MGGGGAESLAPTWIRQWPFTIIEIQLKYDFVSSSKKCIAYPEITYRCLYYDSRAVQIDWFYLICEHSFVWNTLHMLHGNYYSIINPIIINPSKFTEMSNNKRM